MAFVPNLRNVRLYQNTGFDIINAPATPSLLDSFTYVDIPAINALQITRLSSVCIKATEDQVTNSDYCRISDGTHNVYYAVIDYHMEKPDTCTLFIVMDNMLTAGGITGANWDVLDGITERHHIASVDDIPFAYTEDDPFLVPSKPLGIHYEQAYEGKATNSNDSIILIEATTPLDKIGDTTITPEAVAYETTNGEQCVVPKLPKLITHSKAAMYDEILGSTPITTMNPGTGYFNSLAQDIQEGIARVRDLGIESGSIISQVIIPNEYIDTNNTTYHGTIPSEINTITGKKSIGHTLSANFNFIYGTVHNKRVYAGICNKYGILAIGSGNSVEFNPEDIYGAGDSQPSIGVIVDPRPSGKPYFRYVKYKGSTSNFFLNCIAGLNWQNVPLLYTDKSGSEIDTIRFNTEQSIKNQNMEVQMGQKMWDMVNPFNNKQHSMLKSLGNNVSEIFGASVATVGGLTGAMDTGQMAMGSELYDIGRKRQNAAAQELQEFNINQNIVAPQLMFPRSEGLRDFLGNGCYAYRYYLETSDLAKFDKILTMYGYRITEPLTKTMFNVRSKFNYIKAKGVSIGGSLPKWLREGMAQELAIGKRFWKVAPDKTIYTNGGNT